MSTWGNAELLIQMLDRQLSSLLSQQLERRVVLLGRWLGFLKREPQLNALVIELVDEVRTTLRQLTERDHAIREKLEGLWKTHEPIIRSALGDEQNDEVLKVHANIDEFGAEIAAREPLKLPRSHVFDEDKLDTEVLVQALRQWLDWGISRLEKLREPVPEGLIRTRDAAIEATLAVQYLKRVLGVAVMSLPGAAHYRLRRAVREATPVPPPRPADANEDAVEEYGWAVAFFERMNEFAKKVHSRESFAMRQLGPDDVTYEADRIAEDAELVTHELQMRLLAGRSRVALVRRYAAQCEGFDAGELRERIEKWPGVVEQQLTLNFAKYLFQQGLTPILDATIGGLRPDVIEAARGGLFYVEAKQYGEGASRATIAAAYRQVWSTWGRLGNVHDVPEAFLLVFRVGGPRFELPDVMRHRGRALYSVLVDVSSVAGSREKATPISFEADELLPQT